MWLAIKFWICNTAIALTRSDTNALDEGAETRNNDLLSLAKMIAKLYSQLDDLTSKIAVIDQASTAKFEL